MPTALYLLGLIAYQTGQHELAIEYIERAIQLLGAEASYYNNLGVAYNALQKTSTAIACYQRALQLKPDYPDAQQNLKRVCESQALCQETIDCCPKAFSPPGSTAAALCDDSPFFTGASLCTTATTAETGG